MIKQSDKILATALIKEGVLTQQAVDTYLSEIQSTNETLKSFLIRQGHATEIQTLDALSSALHLPILDLKHIEFEESITEKVPIRFAWYFKFMPVKIEDKTLTLATSTPLDIKFQDEIRVHLGYEPRFVLARESDIMEALNKYYGLAADTVDRLSKESEKGPGAQAELGQWVEDLEKETEEASVSKLVNQILFEAYKQRATDIHIEPYRHKVRVRYRIDGILVDANIPPAVKPFMRSIISRIKILANLSIVEKRIPQDGSAVVKTREQDLDLRISTIPAPHGESMVIRILPTNITLLSLERLGLDQENLTIFRAAVRKPNGIILVTGPTGSGKTTTLYACLNEINAPDRKIITLEDPIEYEMEGITQIQVNPHVHLDFAAGLRSILRHDPDIIMVGEIRDLETAEIAIRTALTGHVVFSTLHTNDAASGITRLIEMGVEPFLVASSIEAFVAQRLVRIICSQCKEEVQTPLLEIKEEMAKSLKIDNLDQIKIYQGRGCAHCNQTGYYGRTAIYEILAINEDIRAAILEKQRADRIKSLGIKNGMSTLRQDGWQKVLAGLTTPMEVLNITVKDDDILVPSADFVPDSPVSPGPAAPDSLTAASQTGIPVETRIVSQEVLKAKNEYNARTYTRMKDKKVGIRYSIVQQDKEDPRKLMIEKIEHSSITKDISAGGIRFVSGYTLPVGTIISLKIQLSKEERSIDCLAKVCRIEDDNLSAMYNLVAYYLDIPSADRVKIDDFVQAYVAPDYKGADN